MMTAEQYEQLRESWRPTPEKVECAVKTAIEVARPSRVFLFGSWARDQATADSDLDLAIFLDDDRTPEIPELRKKIRSGFGDLRMSVDLVFATEGQVKDFLTSINSIYYEIVHEGKLVYDAGIDKEAELLLAKAAEDEAVLMADIPEGPFGFHVQRAVEKLLKALLCQLAIKYKRTHDLEYLTQLLHDRGETVPKGAVEIAQIESFGVAYRYDTLPDADILDRPAAIETVRLIREHITARIAALAATP